MRVHYALLLAAGAFFASAEADAAATDSAPGASTADRLVIAERDDVSASRFLRAAATAPETEEERLLEGILKPFMSQENLFLWKYRRLKLNKKTLSELLRDDSNFPKWLKFVASSKNPASSALAVLMGHPFEFPQLYGAIQKMKKGDTLDIATMLELKLLEKWMEAEIHVLKLDESLINLVLPSNYLHWRKHPNELLKAAEAKVGTKEFAQVIEKSLSADFKEVAKTLQQQQFVRWGEQGHDPAQAFDFLGLQGSENLLDEPNLKVWLKYVTHLTTLEGFPKLREQFLKVLRDVLAEKLVEAMKNPETKDMATKLRNEVIELGTKVRIGDTFMTDFFSKDTIAHGHSKKKDTTVR